MDSKETCCNCINMARELMNTQFILSEAVNYMSGDVPEWLIVDIKRKLNHSILDKQSPS